MPDSCEHEELSGIVTDEQGANEGKVSKSTEGDASGVISYPIPPAGDSSDDDIHNNAVAIDTADEIAQMFKRDTEALVYARLALRSQRSRLELQRWLADNPKVRGIVENLVIQFLERTKSSRSFDCPVLNEALADLFKGAEKLLEGVVLAPEEKNDSVDLSVKDAIAKPTT